MDTGGDEGDEDRLLHLLLLFVQWWSMAKKWDDEDKLLEEFIIWLLRQIDDGKA